MADSGSYASLCVEAKGRSGSSERESFDEMLGQIETRAAARGLDTERVERGDGDLRLSVSFGESARVLVFDSDQAEAFLAVPFENYRAIPGYEALYSTAEDEIEARLRPSGPFPIRNRRPFDQTHTMVAPDGVSHHEVELTTVSAAYLAIQPGRSPALRIMESAPVLKLRGFGAQDPKRAQDVLEELAPAVLFELDIVYDVPVEIVKVQDLRRRSARAWPVSDAAPEFPANVYDDEPVALYMYGRSARGMPLLEYLAYYQSIEFYFPRYAAVEVRRRVERVVKDPRFNPHLDRDIGRLVEVVRGKRGRTYGSELDQLKATFRSCVEPEEIKEFVQANEQREEFFRDRRSSLTPRAISLADRNTDLRDAAANRIYDLRCRIVHTKDEPDEGELERLLPNSPEVQLLGQDLALLRLLAVRVIVASSRELVL